MSGTPQGEWLGISASGGPVTFEGVDIIRVRDGVCTEHWGWNDSWQFSSPVAPRRGSGQDLVKGPWRTASSSRRPATGLSLTV